LLLLACGATQADRWQLDVTLHKLPGLLDASQRLTKDLGGVDLYLGARQFKAEGGISNHLNLSLRGEWFGVEYLTGENVTNDMRQFSLFRPGAAKAEVFKTPCSEVLHGYVHRKLDGGFVRFDWFRKDNVLDEVKLHARAEF